MLGYDFFYRKILRSHVIAFGSIFSDIKIKEWDATTSTWLQETKVPVSYGSKEKHLARVKLRENTNESVAITLPRIGFVITGVVFDSARSKNKRNQFVYFDPGSPNSKYLTRMAVPYNISFELAVITKKAEEASKIVEQILPFFQPDFNVTIKFPFDGDESQESTTISLDVPVVLDDVSPDDNYEGDFESRRAITWTFTFSMKAWFFGPTTSVSVIKKVIVDLTRQNERIEGIPTVEGKTLDEILKTDDWEYVTTISDIPTT